LVHCMSTPRYLALQALRAIQKGIFADIALEQALHQLGSSDVDRRFVTELVYGTIRRQRTLDTIINQLADKPAAQQSSQVRLILHIGLYQLRFLTQVPSAAIVHTTVDLAKQSRLEGLAGFINGILRHYLRLMEQGVDPLDLNNDTDDPIQQLGIAQSYPDWILQVWRHQIGLAETEQLCTWFNQPPHLDLRVNCLKTTVFDVITTMQSVGIQVEHIPGLPQGLRVRNHSGPVQLLPGFEHGAWIVQDGSAQLVSHLLDPQPHETVIDVCAAPGGKTTHIAELMEDQGVIWACDRAPSRLKRLQENLQRLGIRCVQMHPGDARQLTPHFQHRGDRVLLDAPCSGLGTLNRHADARWRQTQKTVAQLSLLQLELLTIAATWVKPTGVLVYSTCTLHPSENEQVITTFLQNHPDWKLEDPTQSSPGKRWVSPEGWIKVWPHRHKMDGFFMAKLRHKA
jgi:16S rRNA (cytosine967-C5)-methyltransferase